MYVEVFSWMRNCLCNFQYNELHTCITMNGYPQAPVRGVEPKTSEGSGVQEPRILP